MKTVMASAGTPSQKKAEKQGKLPSGPQGYPLIGHLNLFKSRAYHDLFQMMSDWAKDYGDIYALKIGPKTIYILNGYECNAELFNHPDIDGRNPSKTFVAALGEGEGPASAHGKKWSCQRHYAKTYFSNASRYLEKAVTRELNKIISTLSKIAQEPIDIEHELYRLALYNILCTVTFGKTFDYSDDDFKLIVDAMDTITSNTGPATVYYTLNLPFGVPSILKQKVSVLKTLFEKFIRQRKDYLASENASSACYVDGYLLMQMNKQEDSGHEHFTDANLLWATFEMFMGGTSVPINALSSILIYLINYPEVQIKCQEEIESVFKNDVPTFAEHHRLPYVQATLAECMRLANNTPLGVPRVATKTIYSHDYVFPKGTTFMSNLYSFMMDPTVFPEPEKFNPSRFLDADGKYQRPKELAPFGIGMRSCLGEQLAWMELFLITCGVLQKFTVSNPDGHPPPMVTTGTSGVARSPMPFKVHVTQR